MPNGSEKQAVFLQSGDPENENVSSLYAPGTLGARFTVKQPSRSAAGVEAGREKKYQLVRTDSTMTVAPYPGAVAWWSDKAQYLVTTTATNRNRIAGVFQNSVTPGNYTCVQVGGPASVKFLDADMGSVAIGEACIPSATNGKATRVAVGTAPTHTVLGWVAGPALSVNAPNATAVVDLAVPETT